MNSIRQRIPNYIETGLPAPIVEFETLEDLMKIEWVSYWGRHPSFTGYSIITANTKSKTWEAWGNRDLLVAEMEDGKFRVIGFLATAQGLDLPEWESYLLEDE